MDIVFYGDSITEAWRGTDMDKPIPRASGVKDVFASHFAAYKSLVLAIAGTAALR